MRRIAIVAASEELRAALAAALRANPAFEVVTVAATTNIIIDITRPNPSFVAASRQALNRLPMGGAGIGPMVYAELSAGMTKEGLDNVLREVGLTLLSMTDVALYEAGQAFAGYRARGGTRDNLLADFLVGAHAKVDGVALLTRDPKRYRTAFPDLVLIEP